MARPSSLSGELVADPEAAAVGQVASVYVGPHQLLVMAEIEAADPISGRRLRQLLAELAGDRGGSRTLSRHERLCR